MSQESSTNDMVQKTIQANPSVTSAISARNLNESNPILKETPLLPPPIQIDEPNSIQITKAKNNIKTNKAETIVKTKSYPKTRSFSETVIYNDKEAFRFSMCRNIISKKRALPKFDSDESNPTKRVLRSKKNGKDTIIIEEKHLSNKTTSFNSNDFITKTQNEQDLVENTGIAKQLIDNEYIELTLKRFGIKKAQVRLKKLTFEQIREMTQVSNGNNETKAKAKRTKAAKKNLILKYKNQKFNF